MRAKALASAARIPDSQGPMEKLAYDLQMRCPVTRDWTSTGITMTRSSFETATFEGIQSGCSACRGIHAWERPDLRLG
jgi:hypothetical protein